jgi:hypothetical protein
MDSIYSYLLNLIMTCLNSNDKDGTHPHSSDAIDPHAKGSLVVDLHNPLPVNVCPHSLLIRGVCQLPEPADVAAELAVFIGADLI